ncbi:hypothetical protein [Haloflavibacter putidus]|uniref:Uncharacterized protein n=1 Tax=Haloflavibacter putidus TaxID=2576776 RepID=A0A507ZQQ8_9FLAO|nr:hypothetical protein [Haloflavibacter putidus]TQD39689.1 hypothetical protein FKR84_04125 [Haloflavibacter putidus]
MSKYRIFYLDDEKEDLTIPYKKKLEITNILDIDLKKPYNFEKELDRLAEELENCDALILDLQLDGPQEGDTDKKDEEVQLEKANKFKVRYQAPPLAQMIRTLASEGKISDLPIILCSTEDRVKDSFNKDFTSHDLFDWTFLKDDINGETIAKIVSLINGYQRLTKNKKDFSKSLGRDYNELDQRILSRFIIEDKPPIHELARVIFKDIVQPTGVLINEYTLAARLGVDLTKNVECWNDFIDKYFSKTKYDGVFFDSWNRWWNDMVNDVFEEITDENLASLDANTRVKLLNENTEFKDLIVAKPIELFESTNFWNICEITKKPLDPFEGFKISGKDEPKPWQDYSFISLFAIVTKPDLITKNGIKIHPSDSERLNVARKKID